MKKKIKVESGDGEKPSEKVDDNERFEGEMNAAEKLQEEAKAEDGQVEKDAQGGEQTEEETLKAEEASGDSEAEGEVEEDEDCEEEGGVEDNFGEELAVLRNELEAIKEENQQNYDKYLRAIAELENTKKRAQKDRSDLLRYAGEHLARDILEVADSLDLALKEDNQEAKNEADFIEGVKLIRDQLIGVLNRHSIKAEPAIGGQFDPEKHDAMVSVPTNDQEPGTIIEEFKKAYYFKDKLLRAAQVVVAAKLEEKAADSEEDGSEESEESEEESTKDKKSKKKK